MSDGAKDKVQLIAILEIIFLTFIAIFSIAFISVPNLFIQNAFDNANHSRYASSDESEGQEQEQDHNPFTGTTTTTTEEPDFKGIEDAVSRLLIFVDFALIFLLIIHTLIVIGFSKAVKQRDDKKFRPWFIFNCILVPMALAGTLYGFIKFCCLPIAAFNHVLNLVFLIYKGWAMYTVFMYMRRLQNRVTLNSGEKNEADDDD